MRISDWSSDVCSSDLHSAGIPRAAARARARSGSPFYGDAERGSPSAGVLFEPRDRQEFFGRDADRGAGRAGAHAGGAAGDPLAHVAFDRDLLGLFLAQLLLGPFGRRLARSRPPAEQQPAEQARLGRRRRFHADHAIGAVAHAAAAARSEEHTSELQSLMRTSY